jgi:hypothetical protein
VECARSGPPEEGGTDNPQEGRTTFTVVQLDAGRVGGEVKARRRRIVRFTLYITRLEGISVRPHW